MSINSFQDLIVWQRSMDLCEKVYSIVRQLPREELYALSDQIRRSAVSIPSNIAEGQQRTSSKEFAQFLSIARGSLGELVTQLLLVKRLNFCQEEDLAPILSDCFEIGKMLSSLISKIQRNDASPVTNH